MARPAVVLAPLLLGAELQTGRGARAVRLRITEVEAYEGAADPGSHGYRGRTERNRSLFGPPGTLYVYLSYGMHFCANLVCGDDGAASAVLLRGGEVLDGIRAARRRRGGVAEGPGLANGPAKLAQALGLDLAWDGAPVDLARPEPAADPGREAGRRSLRPGPAESGRRLLLSGVADAPPDRLRTGPRVGVSGAGGTDAYPWRFWLDGEPTVSRYRAAKASRGAAGTVGGRATGPIE
ncbi:DNA-3-methyladenine glycosylase [Zafaria sp. J156]|uniref:DNA-3-methyladenine glycosylase n=1 Tax=Zafaria sp. J156 TaxID=3116490 RepID=UPI002E78E123|nr:DNA-3-methyladenine glycosylase [Zafaria sp. J156]MEE1622015.1 DNA-3-methyladenine glycosylase [Zafaria sp. J156]